MSMTQTEKLYNPQNRQYGFIAEDSNGTPCGIIRLYFEDPKSNSMLSNLKTFNSYPNMNNLLEERFYVGSLYVDPNVKSQRVGSQLMAFAEAFAKEHGVKTIFLNCMEENRKVKEWYERLGYQFDHAKFIWPLGNARPVCLTGRKAVL